MKIKLTAILLLASFNTALAQFNETIQTGRPGQAIGPLTVGKGIFQVQTGFDVGGNSENKVVFKGVYILPNTVIRLGITRHFELSSALSYRRDNFSKNDTSFSLSGINNFSLGTRINVFEENKYIPAVGVQARLKLPRQDNDYKQKYLAPIITLIASKSISNKISSTINLGVDYNGNDAQPTGFYVANLGYSISQHWAVFLENYGNFTRNNFENRWDTGLAWLVNNNLQLDVYGGIGFNNGVTDYFGSIGFSWRTVALREKLMVRR